MEFGYGDWLSVNFIKVYIITALILFPTIYGIVRTRLYTVLKVLVVPIVVFFVFQVVGSILFITTTGEYIQDYRQSYVDNILNKEERDYIKVSDVQVTNNHGNSIPKFSSKDKEKYVAIEYYNGETTNEQFVLEQPERETRDGFYLSFVELDKKFVPKMSEHTKRLLGVRSILGYEDIDKLAVESGAYLLKLHVPDEDYETYKKEMERKAR